MNKKLKKLINNRRLLISLAAVCALAFILTATFFLRYVLDYVSAEKAITVINSNQVKYKVCYDKEKIENSGIKFEDSGLKEINDPFKDKDSPNEFIFQYLDRIEVYNNCTAPLLKNGVKTNINGLDCSYAVTSTFVIKNQGAVVSSVKEDLTQKEDGIAVSRGAEPSNAYAFIDSSDGYFTVDLASYKAKFDEFANQNKQLRLTGELWIEFEFTAFTADSEININSATKRGIIIPVSAATFKIDFTGQAVLDKDFPQREIRFPDTAWTVFATLFAALTVAGLAFSIKKLTEEKDAYKKAVKVILKKYGDEIVMADLSGAPPDYPVIDVLSYKELAKFSQTMNKPVICFKSAAETAFYIVCDNILYRFVVRPQNGIEEDDTEKKEESIEDSKAVIGQQEEDIFNRID